MFTMIKLSGFSGIGSSWGAVFMSPFWFLIDTITQAFPAGTFVFGLPLAFWPHIYFTDGVMGWSFVLLNALGMWLVILLRHIPEFRRIKRGEAQIWSSLKTSEMLK